MFNNRLTTFTHVMLLINMIACAKPTQSFIDEEQFLSSLRGAFNSQKPVPSIYNGTLQFSINTDTHLTIRNSMLTLQIPAKLFLEAGLITNDLDIFINKYILYNKSQQSLIIALSHAQTMDLQYLKIEDIIRNTYKETQEELSPLHITEKDGFLFLTDGVLMLKWNDSSFKIGIHQDILTSVGVEIKYLKHYTLESDYLIVH